MNKILIINPEKMGSIKLINEFDKNNIITSQEGKKETSMSEEEYRELQKKGNEVEHQLINEQDGKTVEICYISGVRDIKQCTLSFKTTKNIVSKKMLKYGIDYAFNTIGMETIFINVDKDNQKIIKLLEEQDFINLGEVKGKTTYLKEKIDKEIGSMKSEYYQKH